ncbi:hypothetical protein QR685DRAFT_520225 [Neurospora intermedia]|uniref:Uncharacterized protein n=1 Tax=Neurospora intermedia TaxID=5142 RepID=A0ABR3DHU6_NEUIN
MTPPPITNANTLSSEGANPTVVVSDVVYAIGYPVQVPINSFPAEAIAGTVTSVLGLLAIAGLALFLYTRRQRREFLNLGNELNDLYGPKRTPEPTNTFQSGVQISGSSSFKDDRTIVEDGAYSRKSKESERSQQRHSPFDEHQSMAPPVNTPEKNSLHRTSIHELQSEQQGLNQKFNLQVEEPDQQAPQHGESHSHSYASEHDLPIPSPFELDKPQLPALSHQGELKADDIVNVSNFGDETFASAHSNYDSSLFQGLTVGTARPERLSRAYPKVVYVEQKDDGKSLLGEAAK